MKIIEKYLRNVYKVLNVSNVYKHKLSKHASTRINEKSERRIEELIRQTGLKRAEILRRLIYLGLDQVKEPADLLKAGVKGG